MAQNKNQIELVNFKALGSAGEGIGELASGKKIFVSSVLAGEEANIQITKERKSFALGKLNRLSDLKVRSKHRVDPECAYFNNLDNKCGGCQIMHLNYEGQLIQKRQLVVDAFERIGKFKNIKDMVTNCVASPEQFNYRNKLQMPVGGGKEKTKLGLYQAGTHQVVKIDRCLTQNKSGNKVLEIIQKILVKFEIRPYDEHSGKGLLRHILIRSAENKENSQNLIILVTTDKDGKKQKQILHFAQKIVDACAAEDINIAGVVENINTRKDNLILGREYRNVIGESHLEETLEINNKNLKFKISPAAFFQVNKKQAEKLYAKALELLSAESIVLDAFCGIGTLSLFAAQKVKKVFGLEVVEDAILDAQFNAEQNGVENAKFICGKVEDKIESLLDNKNKIDTVILNPPRAGCKVNVLDKIGDHKSEIKSILYISCNPATLARDCAILADKGYKISHIEPFDMFPQTMHVECVVKLEI